MLENGVLRNGQQLQCALVNSYEDTMDQKHVALGYESISCHNHGEYLSHSRDILVEERKNELLLPHTFVFSCCL